MEEDDLDRHKELIDRLEDFGISRDVLVTEIEEKRASAGFECILNIVRDDGDTSRLNLERLLFSQFSFIGISHSP